MAGVKGRSGPPGNQNNFKHGLSAMEKRHQASVITEHEDGIRTEILAGLIQDKGLVVLGTRTNGCPLLQNLPEGEYSFVLALPLVRGLLDLPAPARWV